jgi:hypothetical protein
MFVLAFLLLILIEFCYAKEEIDKSRFVSATGAYVNILRYAVQYLYGARRTGFYER